MSETVKRLRSADAYMMETMPPDMRPDETDEPPFTLYAEAADEIERLQAVVDWVDGWVHNPVGSYSVSALDGLFGMARDKIAALRAAANAND